MFSPPRPPARTFDVDGRPVAAKRLPTGCSPNGIQWPLEQGRPPPRKRSSASRCSGPREEPRTRRGLRCLARCALTPVEPCRRRRSRAPPRASGEIRNLFDVSVDRPRRHLGEAIPSTRGRTRLDRLLGTGTATGMFVIPGMTPGLRDSIDAEQTRRGLQRNRFSRRSHVVDVLVIRAESRSNLDAVVVAV